MKIIITLALALLLFALGVLGSIRPATHLDPLAVELPASATEFVVAISLSGVDDWRMFIWWDFLFVAGYMSLFLSVHSSTLPDGDAAVGRNDVRLWGSATALADALENVVLLIMLGDVEHARPIADSTASALAIIATGKWLLLFVTCRALSSQLRCSTMGERLARALLRGAFGVGVLATSLSLLGMPARPIIAVAAVFALPPIAYAAGRRLLATPFEKPLPAATGTPLA